MLIEVKLRDGRTGWLERSFPGGTHIIRFADGWEWHSSKDFEIINLGA